jgi:hypothetical protein
VVEDHRAVHHELHETERLLADGARLIRASLQGEEATHIRYVGCHSLDRLLPMPDQEGRHLASIRNRIGGKGELTLDRDLNPIDTSAGYIRRRGRKRKNFDCSQTRVASCRNLEWSWRQIARQKIAGRAQKNRLGQGNGNDFPDIGSMRLFTVAVCTVRHTSRRRAQVPEAGARNLASNISAGTGLLQRTTGHLTDSNIRAILRKAVHEWE